MNAMFGIALAAAFVGGLLYYFVPGLGSLLP